jgi:hypothetical protein
MSHDEKNNPIGRRTVVVGGAVVAASAAAALFGAPEQATAWVKPVVRAAVGVPLAAASAPDQELSVTVVKPPPVNEPVVSGQIIIKNNTDQAANNVMGYVRSESLEFAVAAIRSVGTFPLAVSGVTFASPGPFPPGAEAQLTVDYAYTDAYEQKETWGLVSLSIKNDPPFRTTGDYIEIVHEQEVHDPPLLDNSAKPYIANDPYTRRVGSVLKGVAQWTHVTPTPRSMEFTWLRDLQPIPGATDINYTATAADVGHLVAFAVAYEKPGYTTTRSHSEGVSIYPA